MWKDPIVEEVRKNRLMIEKENNGDFSLLFTKSTEKFKTKQVKARGSAKNRRRLLSLKA
jgi:hypothetical protein